VLREHLQACGLMSVAIIRRGDEEEDDADDGEIVLWCVCVCVSKLYRYAESIPVPDVFFFIIFHII